MGGAITAGLRGDVAARAAAGVESLPPGVRTAPEWIFQTSRGEFKLVRLPGGRTRLEGRTWYSLAMQPQLYWTPIADAILDRIHGRVLEHIKTEAERP